MAKKIIMIASGKGGTGKSTISVLVGAELAAKGQKVLLIELDSALRSVDIISGVYGKTVYDIEDLLTGRCDTEKAVAESPIYKNLFVIQAPYSGGNVDALSLKVAVNKLIAAFDIILLDTAAGLTAPFMAAKEVCTTAILVITPDTVTIRDGRIAADIIAQRQACELRLLINKLDRAMLAKSDIKDLDFCIDNIGAQLLGVIQYSPDIQHAGNGVPLQEKSTDKRVFKAIAARILGEEVPLIIR